VKAGARIGSDHAEPRSSNCSAGGCFHGLDELIAPEDECRTEIEADWPAISPPGGEVGGGRMPYSRPGG